MHPKYFLPVLIVSILSVKNSKQIQAEGGTFSSTMDLATFMRLVLML